MTLNYTSLESWGANASLSYVAKTRTVAQLKGFISVRPLRESSSRVVSSTFWMIQTLVYSHLDLVSSLLALEASEPV